MPDALKARSRAHTVYKTSDGKRVPGVTTVTGIIAKPYLVAWANRLGLEGVDSTKYRDQAAEVGTVAHLMVQHYLQAADPDLSDYPEGLVSLAENSLLSFFEWEKAHSLTPILLETPLVSERYRFGGTVDCYGELDGILTLLDFKTSKGVYDEHKVQVAGGYSLLLEENGYAVEGVRILRIGRDETEGFDDVRIMDVTACQRAFLAALSLYEAMKKVA